MCSRRVAEKRFAAGMEMRRTAELPRRVTREGIGVGRSTSSTRPAHETPRVPPQRSMNARREAERPEGSASAAFEAATVVEEEVQRPLSVLVKLPVGVVGLWTRDLVKLASYTMFLDSYHRLNLALVGFR